jgi:hypothetical protein
MILMRVFDFLQVQDIQRECCTRIHYCFHTRVIYGGLINVKD